MNNIKIPFLIKFKAIFFNKTKYKNVNIKTPLFIGLIWHLMNYIYIFGGWIFVSHYLDKFFKGLLSASMCTLLSIALFILLNIIFAIFIPFIITPIDRKTR